MLSAGALESIHTAEKWLMSSWVNLEVAAHLIDVRPDELREAIDTKSPEFPKAYKRAGKWMYHRDDLRAWYDAQDY